MARVTFQVLDGLERGDVLEDLPTPVTIGREEDNHIRLNDERVSRFHAKVQENDGRIILTDLESTNGTRVNGQAVQMRVLHVGDQLLIGRCLLLYGSLEQLAELAERRGALPQDSSPDQTQSADSDAGSDGEGDPWEEPFLAGPPELPQNLSTLHTAQVSDLLAYVHSRLLRVLLSANMNPVAAGDASREAVRVAAADWHELQVLSMQLSTYLKGIANPPSE